METGSKIPPVTQSEGGDSYAITPTLTQLESIACWLDFRFLKGLNIQERLL